MPYNGWKLMGFRPWPAPIWQPLKPFFFAALIVSYGIHKLEGAMIETEEWKYDARNPKVISGERKPFKEGGDAH